MSPKCDRRWAWAPRTEISVRRTCTRDLAVVCRWWPQSAQGFWSDDWDRLSICGLHVAIALYTQYDTEVTL